MMALSFSDNPCPLYEVQDLKACSHEFNIRVTHALVLSVVFVLFYLSID